MHDWIKIIVHQVCPMFDDRIHFRKMSMFENPFFLYAPGGVKYYNFLPDFPHSIWKNIKTIEITILYVCMYFIQHQWTKYDIIEVHF